MVKKEVCPLPEELTFKGIRKKVLENVWKRSEEAEKKGIPLTSEDFGKYVHEEWEKAKAKLPTLKADYEKCRAIAMVRKPGLSEAEKVEKEETADKILAERAHEVKDLLVAEE